MVASSGASITLMKSKRPSVDHCSLTVAPSCSISLLTSRMRDGLFLTVWTPSGVRVVSMMYVGMRRILALSARRRVAIVTGIAFVIAGLPKFLAFGWELDAFRRFGLPAPEAWVI